MRRLLFLVFLAVGISVLLRRFAFEGIYIASDSMVPTLPHDVHLFVNKLAYRFGTPQRGDIVMFETPLIPEKGLIKRVIALPGDTFEVRDKKVYLNGTPLSEPYAHYDNPDAHYASDNLPQVTVPPGYVIVLGDNRDVSNDSRLWHDAAGNWVPFLPIEAIQGRLSAPS